MQRFLRFSRIVMPPMAPAMSSSLPGSTLVTRAMICPSPIRGWMTTWPASGSVSETSVPRALSILKASGAV